jgi:hypothetical protein
VLGQGDGDDGGDGVDVGFGEGDAARSGLV